MVRSSKGCSEVVGLSAFATKRNAPLICSRRYARERPRPITATSNDSSGEFSVSTIRFLRQLILLGSDVTSYVHRTCGVSKLTASQEEQVRANCENGNQDSCYQHPHQQRRRRRDLIHNWRQRRLTS